MKRIWNPATFTVSSLSIRLCVPYATARNIVVALLDAGMVEGVGQQKHKGPGKPRSLYRLRSAPGKLEEGGISSLILTQDMAEARKIAETAIQPTPRRKTLEEMVAEDIRLKAFEEQLWREKLKTLREPKFKQPGEDSKGHIQHAMDGDF